MIEVVPYKPEYGLLFEQPLNLKNIYRSLRIYLETHSEVYDAEVDNDDNYFLKVLEQMVSYPDEYIELFCQELNYIENQDLDLGEKYACVQGLLRVISCNKDNLKLSNLDLFASASAFTEVSVNDLRNYPFLFDPILLTELLKTKQTAEEKMRYLLDEIDKIVKIQTNGTFGSSKVH